MTENLQYRLNNYSITPPESAWPNIVAELDKEAQERLSHKLQAAALEPPPGVWENIAETLYGRDQAQVIPIKRGWTRLAVAAVAIGIIVLAGLSYLLLNQQDDQASVTPKKQAPSATNNLPKAQDNANDPVVVYNNVNTGNLLSFNSPRRRMSINNNRIRYAKVETTDLSALQTDMSDVVREPVQTEPGTRIPPMQYLTVAAPNGQPARISAKFADGLNYLLNNESTPTMDMALRSIAWKMRFSKWSSKLLSSTGFIPTASNFMDIVELEELLKDQHP